MVISRRCGDDSLAGRHDVTANVDCRPLELLLSAPSYLHPVCNGYHGYVKLSLHTAKVYVNFETRQQEREIKIVFMFK